MKKLFVFTLGFEEKFAIRMITSHGLDRGDKLLFITGPIVEKTARTLNFIKNFIEKYFPEQIDIEIIEISNFTSFMDLVNKIYTKLSQEVDKYNSIIINLSGGMRLIILATYTTILLLLILNKKLKEKVTIELETEDSSAKLTIPNILAELVNLHSLSKEKIMILKCLIHKERKVKDIAKQLKRDETTIRRHLYDLEELGLVERTKSRPSKYRLSKKLSPLLREILRYLNY